MTPIFFRLLAVLFLLMPLGAQACTCGFNPQTEELAWHAPAVAHVMVLSADARERARVRVLTPLKGVRQDEELEVEMDEMCGGFGIRAAVSAEWLLIIRGIDAPREGKVRRVYAYTCAESALPVRAGLKDQELHEYLFRERRTRKIWQPFSWAFDVSSTVVHAKLARQQEVPNGVMVEVLTPLKNAQAGERLTILGRGLHGGPIALECLSDYRKIFDAQSEGSIVLALSEVEGQLPSRRYYVLNKCGDYALPVYRDQVLLNPDGQKPEKVELEKFLRAYR